MHLSDPPVRTVVWRDKSAGMAGYNVNECVTGFGAQAGRRARSWMKLAGEDVRLGDEEGLRMGMLYDYLFDGVCTGWAPAAWDIEFGDGVYPGVGEIVEQTERKGDLGLGSLLLGQEQD